MPNDVTASERSQPVSAAPIGNGRSSRRRMVRRGLLALPLVLALMVPGASALAAEATTGYGQTTPPPKTETTPAGEAAPTQTSSTPSSETQPAKTSSEPVATTAHAKTLPFTGLDLRWVIVGGVLLLGLGLSIVVVQRNRHGMNR
jgi:hypothetical protein